MNIGLAIGTVLALIFFVGRAKLKANGALEVRQRQKRHNRYVFYSKNFFTRGRFRRIVMRFSSLSCYDAEKVQDESVKLFESALSVALLLPVVGIVCFQNVMIVMLVALVGYIYYDARVDKQIDKVYTEIMKELSVCIQSTRERYLEFSSVPMAIQNCDRGKYLGQPLTQIYDMLTDTDSEEKLYQLCRTYPVRLLKTFATTCYIVNDRGDVRGEDNSSAFADELTLLRQEADTEIRRLNKTRLAFKSLPALALAGLICCPVIDAFLMWTIPGVAALIKGMYGMISKTLLIGITIAAYYMISLYNKSTVVNIMDKVQWIDTLAKKKRIRDWLQGLIPKTFKGRTKLERRIQGSISSKTPEYIYLSKVIYSATAFAVAFIFLLLFTLTAKQWIWDSHKSFSFVAADRDLTERATARLYEVEEEYMTTLPLYTEEELLKRLTTRVPELGTLDAMNETERIMTKYKKYHAIGYKWYYMVISLLAGVAGWFAPEMSLTLRKKMVDFEEVEDVMQLQNLMITLAEADMNVSDVLYWLQQQSTIHKSILTYALYSFEEDPIGSLEDLKDSAGHADFKRLVSKLSSSVYSLSIKEAFSDMALDKEHLLRIREQEQDAALASKKENAKFYAGLPIMVLLFGCFVGPVFVLGVSEIMKVFTTVQ